MPTPKPSVLVPRNIERAQQVHALLAAFVARDFPASDIDPDEADMLLRDAYRALGAMLDLRHLAPEDATLATCNTNVIEAATHLHAAHAAPGDQPRQPHWDMLAEALLARATTIDAYLLRRYKAEQTADTNPTPES
jgi:hypothetical protein